jgi:hypothetical protein
MPFGSAPTPEENPRNGDAGNEIFKGAAGKNRNTFSRRTCQLFQELAGEAVEAGFGAVRRRCREGAVKRKYPESL